MYNTELKTKFITEFSTSAGRRQAAIVLFNSLEPYEEKWGSDFCTRSQEELNPVVSELVGVRTSSQKLRLTILRSYVRWCMKNNVEGACDELFKIGDLSLNKLKRQMVTNPQHLQRYLNYICDAEAEETVDCIYRCFYWLAYGGVDENDVLNVVDSDVDMSDMVVKYGGREYPIYREAIPAFRNCVRLKQFRYYHPNYHSDKKVFKTRANGNRLLRGISERKSLQAIRVDMSRRARNPKYKTVSGEADQSLNLTPSYYRIWLSGLFYRTYEAELAGMPVDFMPAAAQFMEGKTYKLDSGRNLLIAKQRQLARDYLEDYNRWKEAYSI